MTHQLSDSARVQRITSILSSEVDGELVLMNIDSGQYYGLDNVGAAIWHNLENEVQLSELYRDLAREYDADIATIERDVRPWLQLLADENLIEVCN